MESINEHGANIKRIEHHLKNNELCIISASRGENDEITNETLTKKLARDLSVMGYGYIRIKGGYTEKKGKPDEKNTIEKSFIVINYNRKPEYLADFAEDMLALCRKYKQESILLKAEGYPLSYYNEEGIQDGPIFSGISQENIEEYWSKIHNNQFKLIESDDEKAEYSRQNQTFGTKVLRSMLYEEIKNNKFIL